MVIHHMKQNDLSPALRAQLFDAVVNPVDLDGATVTFLMGVGQGTPLIETAATIIDAPLGVVEYQWAAGDTATAGTFLSEFRVIFADGRPETFPNNDYITVLIKGTI